MPAPIDKFNLIQALRSLANELGHTPSIREMNEMGEYSESPYQNEFGSWNRAIEAVGLKPNEWCSKPYDILSKDDVSNMGALGYVVGAVEGDGHLYKHPDSQRGQYLIRLRVLDKEFADLFCKELTVLTGKDLKVAERDYKMGEGLIWHVICHSKQWVESLENICNRVKDEEVNWTTEFKRGFARGLVDSEGSVTVQGDGESAAIQCATVEKDLMDVYERFLQDLGYSPTTLDYQPPGERRQRVYFVNLTKIGDIKMYCEEIGMTISRKKKQLEPVLDR